MTSETDENFERLLEYLRASRGFDFSGYKRASLTRRVQRRMQMIDVDSFESYIDYLEVHPAEFSLLFNVILINVTSFFRDQPVWECLSSEIIPKIIGDPESNDGIRIWSAGCASGEETCSLAMVLCEVLGIEGFRNRVKIYATDADEEALNYARMASYTEKEVMGIPPELLAKYFEQVGGQYLFNKDLRRSVIYGRHDLTQHAPISRVDLLLCRNTLMYFNAEAQAKILGRFHYALKDGGHLILGKAEMLLTHTDIFSPVDMKRRVFTRVPRGVPRSGYAVPYGRVRARKGDDMDADLARIHSVAFAVDPLAQIVCDMKGTIVMISDQAQSMFGLKPYDVGRLFHDLEISYRPVELRSCIDQVCSDGRAVVLRDIPWILPSGDVRSFEVQVLPLIDGAADLIAIKIVFTDITRYKFMQQELQHSKQELKTAYEELQSTTEELVTTNEELQSTNEELETTNEEMQSTNEELETTNEEMQSTNEELETMYEELRQQGDELNQVNVFLRSILRSIEGGVAVTDRDLYVRVWNHRAEDLWGLRSDEVLGKPLFNLDIGLPLDGLRQVIDNVLAGEVNQGEVMLSATNRRGRTMQCVVNCAPLVSGNDDISGVILLMDEFAGDGNGTSRVEELQ